MSKDQQPVKGDENALEQRVNSMEALVLEQSQTIEALRKMLAERVEHAITPQAPAQIVMPNRHLEIERKTNEQVARMDEAHAAKLKAIEAGEYKFMVCIFAPDDNGTPGQLSIARREQTDPAKPLAPWEVRTRPLHPWLKVGADGPDVHIARMVAAKKYNEAKGIRVIYGAEHTIYQIDAAGKPIGSPLDIQEFARQLPPLMTV